MFVYFYLTPIRQPRPLYRSVLILLLPIQILCDPDIYSFCCPDHDGPLKRSIRPNSKEYLPLPPRQGGGVWPGLAGSTSMTRCSWFASVLLSLQPGDDINTVKRGNSRPAYLGELQQTKTDLWPQQPAVHTLSLQCAQRVMAESYLIGHSLVDQPPS